MTRNGVYLEIAEELQFGTHKSLPGGSEGKESACSAGDSSLTPGLGRPPGKGMTIHSSIFAWREPYGQKSPWSRKQLDTAECAKLQMSPLGQVLFMGKSANGQSLA